MAGAPPAPPTASAELSGGYNTDLLLYVNGKKKTVVSADPGD